MPVPIKPAGFLERVFGKKLIYRKDGVPAGFFRRSLREVIQTIYVVWPAIYTTFWPHIPMQLCERENCYSLGSIAIFLYCLLTASVVLCVLPISFTREKRTILDLLTGTYVVCIGGKNSPVIRIARGILYFLFCIALLFSGVLNFWIVDNITDRPLNPEAARFFTIPPFNPDGSLYIALYGLNAPADIKDTYAYGLSLYRGTTVCIPAKSLTVRESGDIRQFCLSQDALKENKRCSIASEMQRIISENALPIERYKSLYQYKRRDFSDNGVTFPPYFNNFLSSHRLLIAQWVLDARNGNTEAALNGWREDTAFILSVRAARHMLPDEAILMNSYRQNLQVLPLLLDTQGLAIKYKDIVLPMIAKEFPDPAVMNMSQIIPEEYNAVLRRWPDDARTNPKQNDNRNYLFQFSRDASDLSKAPVAAMPRKIRELEEKYSPFSFYNTEAHIIFSGFAKSVELFLPAYETNGLQREIALYTLAKSQNIPPKDMAAFLNKSAPTLYDPYTEKPFRWDGEKNSIYFEDQDKKRHDVYYQ